MEIYNESCLEVFKRIPNESVDLIVTDPPYLITARGNSLGGGMLQNKLCKDGLVFSHNTIKCKEYAGEFYRVLKEGTHCYVMTNNVNLIEMLNEFTNVGFHFVKSLIWDKGNKIIGTYYMSQYEHILFFRKGFGKQINNCGTSDILSIPNIKTKDENGNNIHDTEKPVELMKILIENSSKEGDLVLEPFMGSGSTCVAAKMCGRDYIGCEIDEHYFNICKERLDNVKVNKISRLFKNHI